jgi:hypothetical protein
MSYKILGNLKHNGTFYAKDSIVGNDIFDEQTANKLVAEGIVELVEEEAKAEAPLTETPSSAAGVSPAPSQLQADPIHPPVTQNQQSQNEALPDSPPAPSYPQTPVPELRNQGVQPTQSAIEQDLEKLDGNSGQPSADLRIS